MTLLVAAVFCSERILKESTNQKVKSQANWESYDWHENPFREYTEDQVKSLFGVHLAWDNHNINMLIDDDDHSKVQDLPKSFDFRTQWPECVAEVRNQLHCGSCWAFSGTTTLADRFCVASKGKIKVVLSTQDSVSCDTKEHACKGGLLDSTWEYFENTGVVDETCFPYASGDGKTIPHCLHGACVDTKLKYTKYRATQGSSKALSCAAQIKQELVANGPVQTGFMVYEDFMHYKSGIYEFTHGDQLGGHAVKIVGYGEENGKEFWIAQNSWGPDWGEKGFFRIKLGECLFDANAYVGLAKVDDFTPAPKLFLTHHH
jgi:cathepsin B